MKLIHSTSFKSEKRVDFIMYLILFVCIKLEKEINVYLWFCFSHLKNSNFIKDFALLGEKFAWFLNEF